RLTQLLKAAQVQKLKLAWERKKLGQEAVAWKGSSRVGEQDIIRAEPDLVKASRGRKRDRWLRTPGIGRTEHNLRRVAEEQTVELGSDMVFAAQEKPQPIERKFRETQIALAFQSQTERGWCPRRRLEAGRKGRSQQLRATDRYRPQFYRIAG